MVIHLNRLFLEVYDSTRKTRTTHYLHRPNTHLYISKGLDNNMMIISVYMTSN